jgi:hypothetical protein
MKKYISHSFLLRWGFGAFLLAAPVLHGQVLYYPGNFDLEITLGCNCTCFCATNQDVTNTPIGGFLETNGVTEITASAVLAASVNAPDVQYVPPHWVLLYPPDVDFEGWMQTEAVPALAANTHGTLTQTYASPGRNFGNPIYPYPLVPFNYFEQPMDSLPPPADTTSGTFVSQPEPFPPPINQPYPWDINVTNTLLNGQLYVMEQQLVVGPYPPYWGQTAGTTNLETPVAYFETNTLLNISVYCAENGSNLPVYYPTVTATLLPNPTGNIPLPFDDGTSTAPYYEIFTDDLFTNWIWPLTPMDTPDNSSTFAGAGGTMQAQLSLGAGPFTSIPLLVRADRAYKLTISYDLLNCGSNNDYQPMQALTIYDTGLTPPCTNMQITFYTTNCTACVTNPMQYPPCYVTNTGLVDMLQTPDDPPGINVYASAGAINPSQPSYYYAYSTTVTGAPIAALPTPAATYLLSVVASDAYSNPNGVGDYSFWATEDLNTGPAYEYFQSPVAYPIDVPCGQTNNLTNMFVMCPTNPGVVQGDIVLCGPVDSNYYNGIGALNYLQFASYVGGLPVDPSSASDPLLQNVSSIQATGGASLPPFDIQPFNFGYGDAVTEFDNPGTMNYPNQYVGHYSLELAGLESQPSSWSVNDVHLVFGPPVNLDYYIIETNAPYTNVDVSCGTTNINDITNCFGLVTVSVINEFYPAISYSSISITVSGSGPGYTIPPFYPSSYTGSDPNHASFELFLPEGSYTVTAVATVINSQGGVETLYPPSTNVVVNCSCSTTALTNCVCPPTNMVLWLPFDQIVDGNITANLKAPQYPGTLEGNPTPTLVPNQYVDNSLSFNGANYVDVPDYSAIDIGTNAMTLDAWVYRSTNSGGLFQTILNKRVTDLSVNYGYYFAVSNDKLFFQLNSGLVNDIPDNQPMTAGAWHFVAVTVQRNSPTGGQFYVDGVPTANFNPSSHAGSIANTAPLTVGYSPPDGGYYWSGGIDEVEVYDRALASNEIHLLYCAGTNGKCKPPCQPTPPVMSNCPSDMVFSVLCFNEGEQAYTNVSFTCPTASSSCCASNPMVVCTPASGSPFYANTTTTVQCVATDCNGLTNSCSFTVTVNCIFPVIHITPVSPNSAVLNWTNLPYYYGTNTFTAASNWQLQFSTNLSYSNWMQISTTDVPPVIYRYSNTPSSEFFRLVLTGNQPYILTQPPTNVTVAQGGNTNISVVAGGLVPLAYQWYQNSASLTNGGALSGTTTATLTISGAQATNAGTYDVIVSNSYGSVQSSPVIVTVTP